VRISSVSAGSILKRSSLGTAIAIPPVGARLVHPSRYGYAAGQASPEGAHRVETSEEGAGTPVPHRRYALSSLR